VYEVGFETSNISSGHSTHHQRHKSCMVEKSVEFHIYKIGEQVTVKGIEKAN